jgi:spore germination protein
LYDNAKSVKGEAMIIHVVKQGETINSIAELYGKSVDRLILENGIVDADNLVIGETLIILYPETEYTVQPGDTLEGIAIRHNTSILELLRNNPYLSDRQYIYPGEVIVIKYKEERIRTMSINGFVYPFVNIDTLKKTLPFLTYITIYSYYYTGQGEILDINDDEIIRLSRIYGVAPIMMLSGYSRSMAEEIETTNNILLDEDIQNILINNIITRVKSKGYYGVSFNTPYIKPESRPLYVDFIIKLSTRLRIAGFITIVSLTKSVFDLLSNINCQELQYRVIGNAADYILLISYEYGFSFGLSPSVASFDTINNFFEFLTDLVPSEKVVTGLSTIGYHWRLPVIDGESRGQSMSYDSVIALARELGVEIQYDDITKASYFQYISQYEYYVRFRDARGIDALLSLVPTHNLNGTAIWNCMYFYHQLWLLVNSQYYIEKIVPLRTVDCNESICDNVTEGN